MVPQGAWNAGHVIAWLFTVRHSRPGEHESVSRLLSHRKEANRER